MKHLHVVTNSELTTFRTCRARHGFEYIDLLRPLVQALPLTWGSLYHHGADAGWMAAWLVPGASPAARLAAACAAAPVAIGEKAAEYIAVLEGTTFPEGVDVAALCQETEEAAKVASWSVVHYLQQAQADLVMVPLLVEGKYQIAVPNEGGRPGMLKAAGQIDLLLWDRQGGRVVVQDHKGIGTNVSDVERRVVLDTQLVGYVSAATELLRGARTNPVGFLERLATTQAARNVVAANLEELLRATVGSIAYNVVRRAMPRDPNINLLKKSQCVTGVHAELMRVQETTGEPQGEVSVAEIDTLWSRYQAALERQIVERELPATEKQLAKLEALKARGDTYFRQIEHFKDGDAIRRWQRELWVESRRMRASERDVRERTRNPQACTQPSSPVCPFSVVCLAPADPLARKHYRVAKVKHEELEHDGISHRDREREEKVQQEEVGF